MKRLLLIILAGIIININASAQWNKDVSVNNQVTPEGKENYGCEIKTNNNGITYAFMEIPENDRIAMRLQMFDKEGKKLFADEGLLVSNELTETCTLIGERLFIDDKGDAIIIVHDQRTGGYSYTLYKFDEKGNKIWGDVQLNNAKPMRESAGLKICQIEDGSYVITYMNNLKSHKMLYYRSGILSFDAKSINVETAYKTNYIQVEKISRDGKIAWDAPVCIGDENNEEEYSNPFIVNAGFNQEILVYSKGMNQTLMARLLDFDGSSAWDEDMVVYYGGNWGSIPLHVMMNVHQGPEGGAFVSWMDGTSNGNYKNAISYIKNDGTYGFSTGIDGTVISNADDYSRRHPEVLFDSRDNSIYCLYGQFDQGRQSFNGIFMQKMSVEGELLWGAEGKSVVDIQNENGYGWGTIQDVDEKTIAVFYQEREGQAGYGKVNSYIRLYDKEKGEPLSEPINFSTSKFNKEKLVSSQLTDGKYFLANWEEDRYSENEDGEKKHCEAVFIQYINIENLINTAVESIYNSNDNNVAGKEVYTAGGIKTNRLTKGINIVKTIYADGNVKTEKIVR